MTADKFLLVAVHGNAGRPKIMETLDRSTLRPKLRICRQASDPRPVFQITMTNELWVKVAAIAITGAIAWIFLRPVGPVMPPGPAISPDDDTKKKNASDNHKGQCSSYNILSKRGCAPCCAACIEGATQVLEVKFAVTEEDDNELHGLPRAIEEQCRLPQLC